MRQRGAYYPNGIHAIAIPVACDRLIAGLTEGEDHFGKADGVLVAQIEIARARFDRHFEGALQRVQGLLISPVGDVTGGSRCRGPSSTASRS